MIEINGMRVIRLADRVSLGLIRGKPYSEWTEEDRVNPEITYAGHGLEPSDDPPITMRLNDMLALKDKGLK